MQNLHLSSSSLGGGILIGFLFVILPAFLLKVTDYAVYLWMPGISIVNMMGVVDFTIDTDYCLW